MNNQYFQLSCARRRPNPSYFEFIKILNAEFSDVCMNSLSQCTFLSQNFFYEYDCLIKYWFLQFSLFFIYRYIVLSLFWQNMFWFCLITGISSDISIITLSLVRLVGDTQKLAEMKRRAADIREHQTHSKKAQKPLWNQASLPGSIPIYRYIMP